MGGYTALAFAERWGNRLKGLSMIHSTAAPDGEEKKSQRQKTIELIQRGGKDAFIREAVPAMFSTHTRNSAPEIVSEQLERGRSLPGESAIAFYEAIMNRPDRTEVLMKADYPVQWVLGKDDSIVTLSAVLEQTQLSQRAFVQVYEDCGHLAMLESPERLAADLTEFARYSFKT
jgi:pimeloyl-ACP methyl ester carboxylesterase